MRPLSSSQTQRSHAWPQAYRTPYVGILKVSGYLTDYHDAFSPCNLFQKKQVALRYQVVIIGHHDLVSRRDFQPKSRDLVKKPAFSLSQVTSVEIFNRSQLT